jgi:catechol 2,3-dioxygenase-like lactoylglutathione lyase family enzyme
MASHLRYLAVVSERPDTLADFYSTYFSMRELGRSERGDVALTDGFYNLSILKPRRADEQPGFSHFGVEIDDIREVEARLRDFAPGADIRQEEGDLLHGEYRVNDPNGLVVSLSTRHFNVPTTEDKLPSIHHVAMMVPKNDDVLDFYANVFGFRETTTSKKLRKAPPPSVYARFAGDGMTALAILPTPEILAEYNYEPEGTLMKPGPNHFGFLVTDIENFLARLPEGSLSKRPDNRPMTEYRAADPDGNALDVSQHKGFEVDVDRWLTA